MITTKSELNRIHGTESEIYLGGSSFIHKIRLCLTNEMSYFLWKYVHLLRICEYYKNRKEKRMISNILLAVYRRKKNRLGLLLGIEIHENCFGEGLRIYHGHIVVNSKVRAGTDCQLHGMNCIGNNGINDVCPALGNSVELGAGAHIIGGIKVHDGVHLAANAVLADDAPEGGLYAGLPAKKRK